MANIPTIYDLKPRFQQLLRPMTRFLHGFGVTANMTTVFAAIASLSFGGWMLLDVTHRLPFLLLPLFMLVRMALNAIDGMIAREYGQQTRLGAILNETGDVISDAALYAPFALLPGMHSGIVLFVVFLSMLTEFVGVLGQVVGAGRRYDGPLGKSDRAFLFGALGMLIGMGVPIRPFLDAGFAVVIALLACTILNRVRQALRHGL